MKVYIDGQECHELSAIADAASILSIAGEAASKEGKVVSEIRVDDVLMDEEAFLSVQGGLTAHLRTQPVRELVRESVDEAINYIPRLTKGLEEISLHFEGGELVAAQSKLADAADGLDWLLRVFQSCCALMAMNEETSESGMKNLRNSLSESINLLGGLYEEKKYFQMALCIRQKLLPDIEKFSVYIQRLRDIVTSTQ